uniref:ZP domain-containing protein n=1 Tax=Callorhinchus milii TaxID=7868 RepID=A0A4W3GIF4_CALMI
GCRSLEQEKLKQCYCSSNVMCCTDSMFHHLLVCTKNGEFLIVITKDVTVPHLNLSSVHLKEGQGKECGAKKISTDVVIFQFPVTACGTQHRMKSGHLVYETDVLAARQILNEHEGSITRDSTFRLHVQCRYNGSQEADLRVNPIVYTHPPPLPATMEGPLHLQLRIAKGRGYQTWYVERDYPILRRLRDPVFVEVRVLNRNDPSLVLILHHCWATPTSEPRHQVQWDVLVHGCPYTGDNYKTLPISVDATSGLRFPSHHKRFVVKTFVFLARNSDKPLSGEVYLHCSAEVCSTSRGDACFTSCSPSECFSFILFSEALTVLALHNSDCSHPPLHPCLGMSIPSKTSCCYSISITASLHLTELPVLLCSESSFQIKIELMFDRPRCNLLVAAWWLLCDCCCWSD